MRSGAGPVPAAIAAGATRVLAGGGGGGGEGAWGGGAGARAPPRPAARGRRGQRRRRAVGNAGQLAGHPRGEGDVLPFQLLLAVAAGHVERERTEGPGLGAPRPRDEAGREGPFRQRLRAGAAARSAGQDDRAGGGRRSVARPWRHLGAGAAGADRRAAEDRARSAIEAELEGGEGALGIVGEGGGQLPRPGVGADVAEQADGDPVAGGLGVDEDPVLLARGGVVTKLVADVDVGGPGAFPPGRRFDRHRADSRSRRAGGPRRRAVLAGLRVGG